MQVYFNVSQPFLLNWHHQANVPACTISGCPDTDLHCTHGQAYAATLVDNEG